VLEAAGIELGRDYPRPMVDHQTARARAPRLDSAISIRCLGGNENAKRTAA
jgi:deoxyribodipyrimidine photolyase